jgi:hypothetical protein
MKTTIVKNSHCYIASQKYGYDTVLIQNAGILSCLKIIANRKKYWEGNKIEFVESNNGRTFKKVSEVKLKRELRLMLKEYLNSKVFLTQKELIECCQYFKIKIPAMLSEQLKIKFPATRQKGWHKDHYNFNKAEKWEIPPKKRKVPARNVKTASVLSQPSIPKKATTRIKKYKKK